jgi:hypothetical protein
MGGARSDSDLMERNFSRRAVWSEEGRKSVGGMFRKLPPSCSFTGILSLHSKRARVAESRSLRFSFSFRGVVLFWVTEEGGTTRGGRSSADGEAGRKVCVLLALHKENVGGGSQQFNPKWTSRVEGCNSVGLGTKCNSEFRRETAPFHGAYIGGGLSPFLRRFSCSGWALVRRRRCGPCVVQVESLNEEAEV